MAKDGSWNSMIFCHKKYYTQLQKKVYILSFGVWVLKTYIM